MTGLRRMPGERAVSRRHLLAGGAAALGSVAVAGSVGGVGAAPAVAASPLAEVGAALVPCWGLHQAGVMTPLQAHASFVGFHLVPKATKDDLRRLMAVWTSDIERLTQGLPALADPAPELAAPPARLTITVAVGPGLWRIGGLPPAPAWLSPLPAFAIDRLEPRWAQPDLLVQIGSDDPVAVAHARQVLQADAAPTAGVAWVQNGFHRAAGSVPSGTTGRNLMGYVDGTVNPVAGTADFDAVVWSDGPPAWLDGGTGMVLRRIRMDLQKWASVDRPAREQIMGRRMSDGAPLTGTAETDVPDLEATTNGLHTVAPLAHVRVAHQQSPQERMLRRPYNYDDGSDSGPDAGLIFVAFAADPMRQFVPIQRRLAEGDLLNTWTTPVGSAVAAVLPGFERGGRLGEGLL